MTPPSNAKYRLLKLVEHSKSYTLLEPLFIMSLSNKLSITDIDVKDKRVLMRVSHIMLRFPRQYASRSS